MLLEQADAEIVQQEWILRVFLNASANEHVVPCRFRPNQLGIFVPSMKYRDACRLHSKATISQRRPNLFVNTELPTNSCQLRETGAT